MVSRCFAKKQVGVGMQDLCMPREERLTQLESKTVNPLACGHGANVAENVWP